jgi:hypothetical protein
MAGRREIPELTIAMEVENLQLGMVDFRSIPSGYVKLFGTSHYSWCFNGDFMVEEWVNNGEQWDDMGFSLW